MELSNIVWIGTTIILAGILFLNYLGQRANQADWGGYVSNTIDGLARLYCRYYQRLHFQEIQLPEQGGAIIACNHISGIDPVLIIAACRRPVHFIIAEDQYRRFGMTWLFRLSGCIPVDRSGGRIDTAFRSALRALEEGKVIALFPQGQIHAGKEPPPRLKRGVHRLSQLSGVPVYPFHISGVKGVGYILRSVIFRGHVRIESFPPVNCGAMTDKACLKTLAEYMKVHHH